MTYIDTQLTRIGCYLAVTVCLLGLARHGFAQGDFSVERIDLPAMKLNHYFPLPDKKFHEADFEWTFKKGTFSVKKGKGAIPIDLVEKLLPEGETADEIEGQWVLKKGNLVLTEIKAGKKKGREEVTVSVFKTAPTVIRIGYSDAQYVFGIDK
jgi:hypothetical protein